jgi:hypothetical protein
VVLQFAAHCQIAHDVAQGDDAPERRAVDVFHGIACRQLLVGDVEEVGAAEHRHQLVPGGDVGGGVLGVAIRQPVGDRHRPVRARGQDPHQLLQVRPVVLGVGDTLQLVRDRLPCEVRLVAATHPLAGQVVRAHHVYRRKYRLWLVVTLPDGGGASVLVEDTDLLPRDEPTEGVTEGGGPAGTLLSVEGVRRLRKLLAARAEEAQQR